MKRKSSIAASLLLAATMMLSACGGNSNNDTGNNDSNNSNNTQTNTESTVAPNTNDNQDQQETQAQTLTSEPFVMALSSEYTTLDYLISNKSVDAEYGSAHFVETLVQHDKFARLVPSIAKDWSVSDDGLVWTFNLRDDVMWVRYDGSDYRLLTAEDYVTAAKYILNPNNGSLTVNMMYDFVAGALEYYEDNSIGFDNVGVRAIDDHTLEYTLISPTPFFLSILTYSTYLPLCQDFLDEIGEENFGLDKDKILYNGSYRLEFWDRDVSKRLVKNDKYFEADRVIVPYIEYFQVGDDVLSTELFKRGEISATDISTLYLDAFMNDPELRDFLYIAPTSSASWAWSCNLRSTNTNFSTAAANKNFRYALYSGFDKVSRLKLANPHEQDHINSGSYVPLELAITPEGRDYAEFGRLPEYRERNRNNFNAEQAVEYMNLAKEELGDSVTWPVTVRILGTASPASEAQNSLLKQNFEEVFGTDTIIVETVIYTSDTYYQIMDEGNFDFAQQGWGADFADPSNYLAQALPGSAVDNFDFGAYDGIEEYIRLYNEALAITDDLDLRYEKFAEAECFLYEEMILMPFSYSGGNFAINMIQNPYEAVRGFYGQSAYRFVDRIYGTTPITASEREEQRAKYEAERYALTH